jgi:hypothetical protein
MDLWGPEGLAHKAVEVHGHLLTAVCVNLKRNSLPRIAYFDLIFAIFPHMQKHVF